MNTISLNLKMRKEFKNVFEKIIIFFEKFKFDKTDAISYDSNLQDYIFEFTTTGGLLLTDNNFYNIIDYYKSCLEVPEFITLSKTFPLFGELENIYSNLIKNGMNITD